MTLNHEFRNFASMLRYFVAKRSLLSDFEKSVRQLKEPEQGIFRAAVREYPAFQKNWNVLICPNKNDTTLGFLVSEEMRCETTVLYFENDRLFDASKNVEVRLSSLKYGTVGIFEVFGRNSESVQKIIKKLEMSTHLQFGDSLTFVQVEVYSGHLKRQFSVMTLDEIRTILKEMGVYKRKIDSIINAIRI